MPMSLQDSLNHNGPADSVKDATAGLFANNSANSTQYLLDEQLFYDPNFLHNSPALSFFSTPELGYLDTPDTVISHDFESPLLSRDNTKLIDEHEYAKDPMFRDVTLFPSNTLDDVVAYNAFDFSEKAPTSTEIFVDAASLSLAPTADSPSVPQSPASEMPPPKHRPIPIAKLQRGRKRKNSDDDYSPASPSLLKRRFSDEDDIKVMLRAKNTEAAARSRARKKAAMEIAEARIQELEIENCKLRAELTAVRAQLKA